MTVRLDLVPRTRLADHVAWYGERPTPPGRRGSTPGALVDEVERAGLRGRGGGWFPTHVKMRAVVESSSQRSRLNPKRRPIVVGNGMEGEPASHKDAVLLATSPHLVLDGLVLAAEAVGADEAVLAIHRGSPVQRTLERAVAERAAAGIDAVRIEIVTPPARYVASEESALAHWIGDGVATPVFPDRPFQRGVSGRPTLVQNVETLAHLALIARFGAAWFAEVGSPSAPGTTLVSVGGAVAGPAVVEVPTGTPVAEILEQCGGVLGEPQGYLTGGYGGAWVGPDGFSDVAWDPESVRAAGGVIGASVLWVLGPGVCPVEELSRVSDWLAGESAGQCGPCLFGLPSISEDVRALASAEADGFTIDRLHTRLGLVSGRGGCRHPDGAVRLVSTGLTAFTDEVRLHLAGSCTVAGHARGSERGTLPVPTVRDAELDVHGRDLR